MTTTMDVSSINQFERLPDELLEKIFLLLSYHLPLTPNNHARLESNSYYYDYSLQQPLLKQTHIDLLQASLACHRFYKIIKSPHFWEKKCREEHVLLPNQSLPKNFIEYEKLFVNNPFHPSFNLLEDNNWRKSGYGQSQIELVPGGSYRLCDDFNRLSPCRVTSHSPAEFFQRDVPLPCRGPESNVFVDLHPVIEFSICIAARWDCGSQCSISLQFSDGHSWKYERTFPQWNDKKWHRITYRYGQYENFPSMVTVHLTGRDTQFWAGFYGIKFAQARLRMLLRTNENGMNEESAEQLEPKAEDELIPCSESDPRPDNLPNDERPSSPSRHYEAYTDEDEYEDEDEDDNMDDHDE